MQLVCLATFLQVSENDNFDLSQVRTSLHCTMWHVVSSLHTHNLGEGST